MRRKRNNVRECVVQKVKDADNQELTASFIVSYRYLTGYGGIHAVAYFVRTHAVT